MTAKVGKVCLLPLAVGMLSVSAGTAAPYMPRRVPPAARATLLRDAKRVAKAESEPHPSDIRATLTTRGATLRLQRGATAPACEQSRQCMDTQIYVVAMRGRFICNTCSPPRGRHAPTGRVLTLEIEESTMFVFGFDLSNKYPQLQSLGAVVRLGSKRNR